MEPIDVKAQLRAFNLHFFLSFLSETGPQSAAAAPVDLTKPQQGAGGALFLSAVAQKLGGEL